MHKALVLTKKLDKASPLLYNVLCTNENLRSVTIKFFAPQLKAVLGIGLEVNSFNIKLTNANIASYDFKGANIRDPALARLPDSEEVALVYETIEWTWNDGGVTAQDSWQERN